MKFNLLYSKKFYVSFAESLYTHGRPTLPTHQAQERVMAHAGDSRPFFATKSCREKIHFHFYKKIRNPSIAKILKEKLKCFFSLPFCEWMFIIIRNLNLEILAAKILTFHFYGKLEIHRGVKFAKNLVSQAFKTPSMQTHQAHFLGTILAFAKLKIFRFSLLCTPDAKAKKSHLRCSSAVFLLNS